MRVSAWLGEGGTADGRMAAGGVACWARQPCWMADGRQAGKQATRTPACSAPHRAPAPHLDVVALSCRRTGAEGCCCRLIDPAAAGAAAGAAGAAAPAPAPAPRSATCSTPEHAGMPCASRSHVRACLEGEGCVAAPDLQPLRASPPPHLNAQCLAQVPQKRIHVLCITKADGVLLLLGRGAACCWRCGGG